MNSTSYRESDDQCIARYRHFQKKINNLIECCINGIMQGQLEPAYPSILNAAMIAFENRSLLVATQYTGDSDDSSGDDIDKGTSYELIETEKPTVDTEAHGITYLHQAMEANKTNYSHSANLLDNSSNEDDVNSEESVDDDDSSPTPPESFTINDEDFEDIDYRKSPIVNANSSVPTLTESRTKYTQDNARTQIPSLKSSHNSPFFVEENCDLSQAIKAKSDDDYSSIMEGEGRVIESNKLTSIPKNENALVISDVENTEKPEQEVVYRLAHLVDKGKALEDSDTDYEIIEDEEDSLSSEEDQTDDQCDQKPEEDQRDNQCDQESQEDQADNQCEREDQGFQKDQGFREDPDSQEEQRDNQYYPNSQDSQEEQQNDQSEQDYREYQYD